jgi:sulfatase modifying factor 1
MSRLLSWTAAFAVLLYSGFSRADTFGSGANSFDIDFVTVGNPGNPADANPNPAGAVPYVYRIGKYEISEQMIDKANALGGLGITKDTRGPDYPATSASWYEAAKFVNWLNTSTGNAPAYKFDANGNYQVWQPTDPGYNSTNLYRNTLAKYVLPSVHEWHKAAYYDPSRGAYFAYPTSSDSVPDGIDLPSDPLFDAVFDDGSDQGAPNSITNAGVRSPFGTFGQGGNVEEWLETAVDWQNTFASKQRLFAGGSWGEGSGAMLASNPRGGLTPTLKTDGLGFRIALVPEPAPYILGGLGMLGLLGTRFVAVLSRKGKKRGQNYFFAAERLQCHPGYAAGWRTLG